MWSNLKDNEKLFEKDHQDKKKFEASKTLQHRLKDVGKYWVHFKEDAEEHIQDVVKEVCGESGKLDSCLRFAGVFPVPFAKLAYSDAFWKEQ